MGSLVGHAAHGFCFFLIGLWHLFNNIKLHFLHPKSYTSLPWFPTSRFKYLELYLILAGCIASISIELFKHHPLDPDGTIRSTKLRNFEHSNISLTFFMYGVFNIILDKAQPPAQYGLTQMLAAIAFGLELLLFHIHSADHMGIEGQYHYLLQIVIFVSLFTTLLGIGYPKSFLNSFIRSFSIMFQGVWLMVIGIMIWTPILIPKGCFLKWEEGHHIVTCHSHVELERAKSLVNIEFSWYLIGVTIFAMSLYLVLYEKFPAEKTELQSLSKLEDREYEQDDVDTRKIVINEPGEPRSE